MTRILECTISGVDAGGFAWENVFHMQTPDDTTQEHTILDDACATIELQVLTPMLAAMNGDNKVFDVSARIIRPTQSYSLHHPQDLVGSRDVAAAVGAVNGKLALYPETGAYVGHQYITGAGHDDYPADKITTGYKSLLQTLLDGYIGINGTVGGFNWQLIVYNRKLHTGPNAVFGAVLGTPTILSKRVRPE